MTTASFIAAIVVLLVVPGPTNTLLFFAGSERGLRRSLPLLIGEVTAYLFVVGFLATLAAAVFADNPTALAVVRGAAAAWVMWLAIKMWRSAGGSLEESVANVRGVFVTTLLNPKGIIIGLSIMPSGPLGDVAPWLFLFAILVSFVGSTWVIAGALASRLTRERSHGRLAISRLSSIALAGFSITLMVGSARMLISPQ